MRRVLRPGGSIGLLWNLFDDRVPWVAELVRLYGAEDTVTVLADIPAPFDGSRLGLSGGEHLLVEHVHPMTRDLLVENLRSRSPILLMPDEQRTAVLARAGELAPAETFDLPYVCSTWRWLPAS
jgi:hypothetical protein